MTTINDTFQLASGLLLKNRLVKAATTEGLADVFNNSTQELATLYRTWATESDVGLIISGNVQVDRRFLEGPGNVAIDLDYGEQTEEQMSKLRDLAEAGEANDCRFFVQLSHAGRQATPLVCKSSLAPSSISSKGAIPAAPAVEATEAELERIKEKFLFAAKACEEAGFNGVELHGAHGYLFSSMLNPLANQRTDRFGGSLENRASLLLETVRGIRENASEGFSVAVKLNSSDFQKGGFSMDEAAEVAIMLADEGIDLLELSGGNYENPAFMPQQQPDSTNAREAYFLGFSETLVKTLKESGKDLPVLVTGGFRSTEGMNLALDAGATDLIGLARPLCADATCTKKLLSGEIESLPRFEDSWKLPSVLGWSFLKKYKTIHNMKNGCTAMVMNKQMADMGNGEWKPLTETDYPNLLTTMFAQVKLEKQKAHNLKGYIKDDEHLQPHINTIED